MVAIYRREEDGKIWHWCTNCSSWPTANYVERHHMKPVYGELCRQCQDKEDAGSCRQDSDQPRPKTVPRDLGNEQDLGGPPAP